MVVERFAKAVSKALLELGVVRGELVSEIVGVNIVNAVGVVIGLAASVRSALCSTGSRAGLIDKELDVLAVAAGTLEGSSVPHLLLQVSEPGFAERH